MSEANLPTEQPQTGEKARFPTQDGHESRSCHTESSAPQRSRSPVSLTWRVERRRTFESLRRARRHRNGPLSISWFPGNPAEPPRVAYSIGRKVGPAVRRNLIRRRLRMLARQVAPDLRPGCYLVGVGPSATKLSYSGLEVLWLQLTEPFRQS